MKQAIFPDDFEKRRHHLSDMLGSDVWQYVLLDRSGKQVVSVVGAPPYKMFSSDLEVNLIHGDGVTTFEMWDQKNEPEPQNWLTVDEINKHLRFKGFMSERVET